MGTPVGHPTAVVHHPKEIILRKKSFVHHTMAFVLRAKKIIL
jgi:hypothetical protein